MSLSREDHIELVRRVQEVRDQVEALMDILMPDRADAECLHPPHLVTDESTMGESLYVCKCGASQSTPFN